MRRIPTDSELPMPTTQFDGVTVATQASVYFDGRCVSHKLTFADGRIKTVGVMTAGVLDFTPSAPEVMECVAGGCEYRLAGGDWQRCAPGEQFAVPAGTRFEVRVGATPYHYICHVG
ncbi:MAG: pyrimidine/purine nucleoside phosphorylase [Rhodoferax sp.]